MPTIRDFEEQVFAREGFEIRLRHARDDRDVRSDKALQARYPYKVAARNEWTVRQFLHTRISRLVTGYNVEVVDPQGNHVNGRTKLRSLRARYVSSS